MTQNRPQFPSNALLEQALAWHLRVDADDATQTDWEALTVWLEEDLAHVRAYDLVETRLLEVAASDRVTDKPSGRVTDQQCAAPQHAPSARQTCAGKEPAQNAHAAPRLGGLAAVAAAILVLVSVFVAYSGFAPPQEPPLYLQTDVGAMECVTLADGSEVHLSSHTALEVRLTEGRREVRLLHGEALFDVAPNKARPFFVLAGDQQVRVVGTEFTVSDFGGRLRVSVAEGRVDVSDIPQAGAPSPVATRLTPGDRLTRHWAEGRNRVDEVDTASVGLWRDRVLPFNQASLEDVLLEVNRHFDKPIIATSNVSDIYFTGFLNTTNQKAVLHLLENTLPIRYDEKDTQIILSVSDR